MNSDKIKIGPVSSFSKVILGTQRVISYNSNPPWKGGKVLSLIPEHKVPMLLLSLHNKSIDINNLT
jgi:hypothetical protein